MSEMSSVVFRTIAGLDHEQMVRWASGFDEPRHVSRTLDQWARAHPAEVQEFIESGDAPAAAVEAPEPADCLL